MNPNWLDKVGEIDWNLLQQRMAALQKALEQLPAVARLESLETLAMLRAALEQVQHERDCLRKDYYARAREIFDIGEVPLEELQRTSAGPVELLD